MANLDVIAVGKKKTGSVDLDPVVFEVAVKPHLFHAEVRRQLASRRGGCHSTKNRAAVSGGGSKPWRQKGTGRARQGTTRAPQWSGGGAVFGPVPRTHDHKLPKKVRRAALRSALSLRLAEGGITVVEAIGLDGFSTRAMKDLLAKLGLDGQRVLIAIAESDLRVERSARNLPGVGLLRAEGLNVYDVLRHEKLLLTRSSLEAIQQRLGTPAEEGGQ